MEQRILPWEKRSHVPGPDELSKHCPERRAHTCAGLARRTEKALQLSSLVPSLKLSFSQHLLINVPPSPQLLLLYYCHSAATVTAPSLARGTSLGLTI